MTSTFLSHHCAAQVQFHLTVAAQGSFLTLPFRQTKHVSDPPAEWRHKDTVGSCSPEWRSSHASSNFLKYQPFQKSWQSVLACFSNPAYRLVAVGLIVEHGRSLGSVAPGLHGPQPHLVLWETLQRISGWGFYSTSTWLAREPALNGDKQGGRAGGESHHGLGQVLDKLL